MSQDTIVKSQSLYGDALKRLKKNKAAVISAYFILLVLIVAALAPWITPYSFEEQNIDQLLATPNATNWLGTDHLGRDLFSRIIYGARVSMTVGIVSSLISLFIGLLVGSFAGWVGGAIDRLIMRTCDIISTIPEIPLMILLKLMIEAFDLIDNPELKALVSMIAALSILNWMSMARMVRGQVLQAREMLYVEAARALGLSQIRIVVRHILPNILGPVIVTLTFMIPSSVLLESFLSFIGLGLQPPYSSWGVLANDGWRSIRTYPHLILFPGFVIYISMLAFNLFGDGLRDAFDPKLKNR
ncbi:MAG: ABC transporter permease [Bdellovibrionales bacterium]